MPNACVVDGRGTEPPPTSLSCRRRLRPAIFIPSLGSLVTGGSTMWFAPPESDEGSASPPDKPRFRSRLFALVVHALVPVQPDRLSRIKGNPAMERPITCERPSLAGPSLPGSRIHRASPSSSALVLTLVGPVTRPRHPVTSRIDGSDGIGARRGRLVVGRRSPRRAA